MKRSVFCYHSVWCLYGVCVTKKCGNVCGKRTTASRYGFCVISCGGFLRSRGDSSPDPNAVRRRRGQKNRKRKVRSTRKTIGMHPHAQSGDKSPRLRPHPKRFLILSFLSLLVSCHTSNFACERRRAALAPDLLRYRSSQRESDGKPVRLRKKICYKALGSCSLDPLVPQESTNRPGGRPPLSEDEGRSVKIISRQLVIEFLVDRHDQLGDFDAVREDGVHVFGVARHFDDDLADVGGAVAEQAGGYRVGDTEKTPGLAE